MKRLFTAILLALTILNIGCSNDEPNTPQTTGIDDVIVTPSQLELEAGESYTLSFSVVPSDAEYTTVKWSSLAPSVATVNELGEVTALGAGEATIVCSVDNIQASCRVTVTLPTTEPQLGDFYYADGSWSSELDAEREVIGIVFWVGDPTADDAALRREHPECKHGLVVGLKHDRSYWQSNFSASGERVSVWVAENVSEYEAPIVSNLAESVNRMMGYNNTKAIELYNEANENRNWPVEAIRATVAYRDKYKAPATSSDWYLPSPKELALLCSGEYDDNIYFAKEPGNDNRKFINERFAELSDINSLAGLTHWSSAEFDEREVDEESIRVGWMVAVTAYFNDGDISVGFKDSNSGYLRYILAF